MYLKNLEEEYNTRTPIDDTTASLALATTHNLLQISLREHLALSGDGELCIVRGWKIYILTPVPRAKPVRSGGRMVLN